MNILPGKFEEHSSCRSRVWDAHFFWMIFTFANGILITLGILAFIIYSVFTSNKVISYFTNPLFMPPLFLPSSWHPSHNLEISKDVKKFTKRLWLRGANMFPILPPRKVMPRLLSAWHSPLEFSMLV
jgi:hypothetical protein